MQGILDLLNSDLGKKIVSGIASDTNQSSSKTADVLTMALPVLTKAMQRNASSPEGAESLMNALNNKHDGNILNNLDSFFGGGVDSSAKSEGEKILGHILGSKKTGVENVIGQKANLDSGNVANILKVAAPILMGVLGNTKKQSNVSSSNDLGGLLGNMLGGNDTQSEQSFLEKILDADGDGSVIDDVAGMFLDKSKNKGGLGSLISGLFK